MQSLLNGLNMPGGAPEMRDQARQTRGLDPDLIAVTRAVAGEAEPHLAGRQAGIARAVKGGDLLGPRLRSGEPGAGQEQDHAAGNRHERASLHGTPLRTTPIRIGELL